MGYRFAKYLVNGGLLLFFAYGLNFNTKKYISLAIISLIFLIQLSILYRLWAKRLNNLESAVMVFN